MYAGRRNRLAKHLAEDSITILPAATVQYRNSDTEYKFRQSSDFFYLTGIDEPDAVLVITKQQNKVQHIIFAQEYNEHIEIWTGKRLSHNELKSDYEVYGLDDLDKKIPELMLDKQKLYYPFAHRYESDILKSLKNAREIAKRRITPKSKLDLSPIISSMRVIKDSHEIDLIKQTTEVAGHAHKLLMQTVQPGMYEYQLASTFSHYCATNHCPELAYPSIVASGKNACTLHYMANSSQLQENDLLLVDAGCEKQYYAADITRTYPINGKFSANARKLYQIVLDSQLAGIAAAIPGNKWSSIQKAILDVMVAGLVELDILSGTVEKLISDKAYMPYYMHNSGHMLGLDVHDPGLTSQDMLIQPGMILTIEPGLYIRENSDCNPKWHNIGIRIEDNILVTTNGNQVLTNQAPKQIDEIEELMSK